MTSSLIGIDVPEAIDRACSHSVHLEERCYFCFILVIGYNLLLTTKEVGKFGAQPLICLMLTMLFFEHSYLA